MFLLNFGPRQGGAPVVRHASAMAGAHNLSKDFFELIKDIGESKSKQES